MFPPQCSLWSKGFRVFCASKRFSLPPPTPSFYLLWRGKNTTNAQKASTTQKVPNRYKQSDTWECFITKDANKNTIILYTSIRWLFYQLFPFYWKKGDVLSSIFSDRTLLQGFLMHDYPKCKAYRPQKFLDSVNSVKHYEQRNIVTYQYKNIDTHEHRSIDKSNNQSHKLGYLEHVSKDDLGSQFDLQTSDHGQRRKSSPA